jgi:hypothetical protein
MDHNLTPVSFCVPVHYSKILCPQRLKVQHMVAGFDCLPAELQDTVLDRAASSPSGLQTLRGVCRHFRAYALLHAHARTTITVDSSQLWEMSSFQAGTSFRAEDETARLACRVLASKHVCLPNLLSLSSPQGVSTAICPPAVADSHNVKLATGEVSQPLNQDRRFADNCVRRVHNRFASTVVPALTQLQVLVLHMLALSRESCTTRITFLGCSSTWELTPP